MAALMRRPPDLRRGHRLPTPAGPARNRPGPISTTIASGGRQSGTCGWPFPSEPSRLDTRNDSRNQRRDPAPARSGRRSPPARRRQPPRRHRARPAPIQGVNPDRPGRRSGRAPRNRPGGSPVASAVRSIFGGQAGTTMPMTPARMRARSATIRASRRETSRASSFGARSRATNRTTHSFRFRSSAAEAGAIGEAAYGARRPARMAAGRAGMRSPARFGAGSGGAARA